MVPSPSEFSNFPGAAGMATTLGEWRSDLAGARPRVRREWPLNSGPLGQLRHRGRAWLGLHTAGSAWRRASPGCRPPSSIIVCRDVGKETGLVVGRRAQGQAPSIMILSVLAVTTPPPGALARFLDLPMLGLAVPVDLHQDRSTHGASSPQKAPMTYQRFRLKLAEAGSTGHLAILFPCPEHLRPVVPAPQPQGNRPELARLNTLVSLTLLGIALVISARSTFPEKSAGIDCRARSGQEPPTC